MDTYILQGKKPILENNYRKWTEWMATANRVVKQTSINIGVEISTVFLGLDHNFWDDGVPVLFETLIFGGERDLECRRYTSWTDAMEGHNEIVKSFTQRCAYCGKLRELDEVQCKHCNGGF